MSNSLFQGQISLNEFVELKAKLNKSSQLSIILWQIQETTFLYTFRRTYVNIRFHKIGKYVYEKHNILLHKYEYVSIKYVGPKGKYAQICFVCFSDPTCPPRGSRGLVQCAAKPL